MENIDKTNIGLLLELGPFNKLRIKPVCNDRELDSFSEHIPAELRQILRSAFSYDSSEDDLLYYLKENSLGYSFFVDTQAGRLRVKWDPSFSLDKKVGLRLDEDDVILNRVGFDDGRLLANIMTIGDKLVVDKDTNRLGIFTEKSLDNWNTWDNFNIVEKQEGEWSRPKNRSKINRISRARYLGVGFRNVENEISVSRESFFRFYNKDTNFKPISIGAISQDVWLSEVPSKITPRYRVVVNTGQELEDTVLKLECLFHDSKIMFDLTLQNKFTALFNKVRQYQSKAKIMFADIAAVLLKDDFSDLTEMFEYFTENRVLLTLEIDEEVKSLFEYMLEKQGCERLAVIDHKWASVKGDLRKEIWLYFYIASVFELKSVVEDGFGFDIEVELSVLFDNLQAVQKDLDSYNIDLTVNERSVEVVNWDVSVGSKETGDKDWFELSPEVFFDNKKIDYESWVEAVNNNGILEDGSKVRIIDVKTREILARILELVPSDNKQKKNRIDNIVVSKLQILDWLSLRRLGVKLTISEEYESVIARIMSFDKINKKPLPVNFKGKLREYQYQGYLWLTFLYESYFGACLADDMGLGKTVQAIAFLAAIKEGLVRRERDNNALFCIVVPPSIAFNWKLELERFCPDFKVLEYFGVDRQTNFEDYDVVLTTYEIVRRDIDILKKQKFGVAIFDEVQVIKNILAERTNAARKLGAGFNICLTGTPLENHLGEYYATMDLAVPGLLGKYSEFNKVIKGGFALDNNHDKLEKKRMRQITRYLDRAKPFMLRRNKSSVLKDLPPKTETEVYLELSDRQKELYQGIVQEVKQSIDDAYSKHIAPRARAVALTALIRLRQVCLSPKIIDPDYDEPSPKILYLAQKLKELKEEGHSVLVFSQFTSFLDVVQSYLKEESLNCLRMDGKTPVKKRKTLVTQFQESVEPACFLISLKTGGIGLNLTKASYVFHLDPWWNPQVENQATDRAHRIGQKQNVFVMRLLTRFTVEEKMMQLKQGKRDLFSSIVDEGLGAVSNTKLSKDDFLYLCS
jgi:SNF2 family DNA or RNA helicase